MLKPIRENDFVREFELNGCIWVDSKYRTCELPFRADYFIARWQNSSDALRRDMLLSLAEFPAMLENETRKLLEFFLSFDAHLASDFRIALDRQRRFPDAQKTELHFEIAKSVIREGGSAWSFVGETKWFRVLQSISEVKIDPKPGYELDPPTQDQLLVLAAAQPEGLFKWALERTAMDQRLKRRPTDPRGLSQAPRESDNHPLGVGSASPTTIVVRSRQEDLGKPE